MGMMSNAPDEPIPVLVKPLPKRPGGLEETLRRQAGGGSGSTILTSSLGLGETTTGQTSLLGT